MSRSGFFWGKHHPVPAVKGSSATYKLKPMPCPTLNLTFSIWTPSLTLTHDLIDHVAGCPRFTVINLTNASNLTHVKEGNEWKMGFCTHLGLYEYTVIPFGLINAPATFQVFIQDTLCDILHISCAVYLDDILIFSKHDQDHNNLVHQVLDQLQGLTYLPMPKNVNLINIMLNTWVILSLLKASKWIQKNSPQWGLYSPPPFLVESARSPSNPQTVLGLS